MSGRGDGGLVRTKDMAGTANETRWQKRSGKWKSELRKAIGSRNKVRREKPGER